MVAPEQLHLKDQITAAGASSSDKVVVLDASQSYKVCLMTLAELDIYVSS